MSLSKPLLTTASTLGEKLYSKIITTLLPRIGERRTWAALHAFYYESAWVLYVVPLLLAEKAGLLDRWRIQKEKYPEPELVREMYWDVVRQKVLGPLVTAFTIYPVFKLGGADLAESLKRFPGWGEFLKGLLVCAVGEDTLFYCGLIFHGGRDCKSRRLFVKGTHRALHSKYLYRFHKQHHRFKQPTGAIFDWAHPVEALFGNLLSIITLPAVLKIHPYTFHIYFFLRISEAVSSHSGYDLPFFPMNWFPSFLGGADRHDFHHSKNVGMYGSLTKFWDWLCGTDRTYWEFKERQAKGLEEDKDDAEAK